MSFFPAVLYPTILHKNASHQRPRCCGWLFFKIACFHHRINSASVNKIWIYLSVLFSLAINMSIASHPFCFKVLHYDVKMCMLAHMPYVCEQNNHCEDFPLVLEINCLP